MKRAFPFSEVDKFLSHTPAKGCLADTNFLIAISDKDHRFHEDAQFLFEKLAEHSIPIYISVTARAEFIDFHRRVIITETLMDMLPPTSPWKISASVRQVLRSQRGWLDNQIKEDNDPYLPDNRIKKCKQAFLPKTQSGHIGWVELCKEYLSNRLLSAWTGIEDTLGLNYIDMRSKDSDDLFRNELKWEKMYRLSEESALASNDAMILNVLDSSVLSFLITSDYDLAYGTLLSSKDKAVLVPDNVYRNHLKSLKF